MVGDGLHQSPTTEVLLEESILGWKEYELELMRDTADNTVVVCSIENVDPVGVHTGDSITVAPALTLTDREYQKLRDIGIDIIRAVGVETGGCNIQFAVEPVRRPHHRHRDEPPGLALQRPGEQGHRVPDREDRREARDRLPARRDPQRHHPGHPGALRADPRLRRREGAPVRVREVPGSGHRPDHDDEIGRRGDGDRPQLHDRAAEGAALAREARIVVPLGRPSRATKEELLDAGQRPHRRPHRHRAAGAARRAPPSRRLFEATKIDPWFLDQIVLINEVAADGRGRRGAGCRAAAAGEGARLQRRPDRAAARRRRGRTSRALRYVLGVRPVFKTVDTCAGEFPALTPYHYSSYDQETEVAPSDRKKVVILGSGPNRIGQGVEFDYSCVHASFALSDGRVRDDHDQLQPGDGVHRLRHLATGCTSSR